MKKGSAQGADSRQTGPTVRNRRSSPKLRQKRGDNSTWSCTSDPRCIRSFLPSIVGFKVLSEEGNFR